MYVAFLPLLVSITFTTCRAFEDPSDPVYQPYCSHEDDALQAAGLLQALQAAYTATLSPSDRALLRALLLLDDVLRVAEGWSMWQADGDVDMDGREGGGRDGEFLAGISSARSKNTFWGCMLHHASKLDLTTPTEALTLVSLIHACTERST